MFTIPAQPPPVVVPPRAHPAAPVRVSLIAPDADDALLIGELLAELPGEPFVLDWAATYEAGLAAMAAGAHDVYLVGDRLGTRRGIDLLREVRAAGGTAAAILLATPGAAAEPGDGQATPPAGALIRGTLTAAELGRALRAAIASAAPPANHAQVLAQVPATIVTADLAGQITFWNQRAEALFGWTAAEAVGRSVFDLAVEPGDREAVVAFFTQVVAERAWSGEFTLRRKDGTRFPALVQGVTLRGAEGHLRGLAGTVIDLSAHRAIGDALREAERKYRTLVEQTPAVTYIDPLQPGGGGRYCSPRVADMTGYSSAEWSADCDLAQRLLYPQDRERIARTRRRCAATGRPFRAEYRLIRKDGRVIWVRDEATLVRDARGAAQCWQGVLLDITDLKQSTALANGQRQVLELLVQGAPLTSVLDTIARLVETHSSREALCSIYTADQTGTQLDLAAAPSLPDDFCRLFRTVPIGPQVGSCGTAAARGETVVVTDIATDPLWTNYALAAGAHNLRACWSVPLLSDDGRVVGTFATYHREARAPDDQLVELVGMAVRLARVAIERTRAREALGRSEARFRSLVQHSSDMITIVERDGTIRYESPAIATVLGYSPEEVIGRKIYAGMHPDDVALVRTTLRRTLRTPGMVASLTVRMRHRDGTWHQLEAIGNNLLADPGIRGIVITARDVTAQRALEARLAHQAFHDTLTALPNRALFLDRLTQALARAQARGTTCAVLFLDLDQFKDTNDTLGHDVGDQLLIAVARRLRAQLTVEQTLARLGGDEFTILLEDLADHDAAVATAEALLRAFEAPFAVDDQTLTASTSIGIVVSRAGQGRPEDLLRDADIAMYRAKALGKGRCAVFDARMQQQLVERLALEQDLRRALAREEFVLHYQPIVDLRTGELVEAEALIRWQHPTRGLLPPADFIPLAEKIGLIRPLGRWVLREAARQARAWQGRGRPLTVVANLTANEFQQATLVAEVADVLAAACDLDPRRLRLEITESIAMSDPAATIATLAALRALGVRVAIDDFGTGYSSLAYLQRLPVDALKIDRGFVRALDTDPASLMICRSVTLLAHALGLHVTAEGIETAGQAARLRELGCDQGQGYYFAHPVPAEELTARLLGAGDAPRSRTLHPGP